jgi:hypothetical protein
MLRIRAFENSGGGGQPGRRQRLRHCGARPHRAKVRGPLHLSTGRRRSPPACARTCARDDYLTSTHRGHGHTLAKGADMQRMMAELFGKATGCNKRQGRLDAHRRLLGRHARRQRRGGGRHERSPSAPPTRIKLQRRDASPRASSATARSTAGPFHEGLNWARVYALPVLLVCEDNRWSATTASGLDDRRRRHPRRERKRWTSPALQRRRQRRRGGARGRGRPWWTTSVPAAARGCCTR